VLLQEAIDELAEAQWPWGEWGHHEAVEREPTPSIEGSRLKPNLFTSAEAALALIAAAGPNRPEITRFRNWIPSLRDSDGYWQNAAAPSAPGGPGRRRPGFVRNVRHTAKGLDLTLFFDEHTSDDAAVLRWTLGQQHRNGGFPQYAGGQPDPWATAYTMDLLIRFLSTESTRWASRGQSAATWERTLRTALDRARGWITERIDALTQVPSIEERRWEAAALGIEVGSHLAQYRADAAQVLARMVFGDAGPQDARDLWALVALWPALDASRQLEIVQALRTAAWDGEGDTLEWACRCKVLAAQGDILFVQHQYAHSGRHSSALATPAAWDQHQYRRWVVQRVAQLQPARLGDLAAPAEKATVWKFVAALLDKWRTEIEDRRGWELLWDGDHPRDERTAQISFNQTAGPLARQLGSAIMVREPETGRGPVDFEFSNGVQTTVLVEFKRMDGALRHGLMVQLPEYLRASGADSAFLVCIGFAEQDKVRYERFVEDSVQDWQRNHPMIFLHTVFVDARRRTGASSS